MLDHKALLEYDVVGYKIVSPLHLVSLLAFCERRYGIRNPKILVILSKGPWDRNILDVSEFDLSGFDICFVEQSDVKVRHSWETYFLTLLRPLLFLFVPFRRKTKFFCSTSLSAVFGSSLSLRSWYKFHPILLDEGIGTYNFQYNIRNWAKGINNVVLRKLAFYSVSFVNRYLWLFGAKRENLFGIIGGEVFVSADIKESLLKILRRIYSSSFPVYSADILLVTQPYMEMGMVNEEDYLSYISNLINYATSKNKRIIVKAHPAEKSEKYIGLGCNVWHDARPIEALIATGALEIKEVWGFNSTSLITLPELFDIESKYLESPWARFNVGHFGPESRALFDHYSKPLVSDSINFLS